MIIPIYIFLRYIHKKTFYPNQTSKIYSSASGNSEPSGRGLFSPDYYENFPKQINISPVHGDYPKLDLSDIVRRPFSSQLSGADWYMKRDEYPKFTPASGASHNQPRMESYPNASKSPDENLSMDEGSSSLSKSTRRNSREDDPNEQNESKI